MNFRISGSYGNAFLSKYWHMQRTSQIHCLTVVKNNLHSNIHTDWNWLDLNWHFYVVKATLEANVCIFKTKIISFERVPKRSNIAVLTDLKNKLKNRSSSKQQEGRIHLPETVWLFKWKEVNRILKEYFNLYFYQWLCALQFFFSSSFQINRIQQPNGRKHLC